MLKVLEVIFWILSPLIGFALVMLIAFLINFVYFKFKGYKMKGKVPSVKKAGILKRIFIQFPRRLVLDIYNRDPLAFMEHGLHLFCGEQGAGKTVALVEMVQRWKQRYPKMKVYTNMCLKDEDGQINHWKDILEHSNGEYGVVEVIDEIQTWFSSLDSKNFPPEMITEVSQQRKQRKAIVGTAQVFSRIAKPIREQATYIYLPMTIFGCLTIVRKTKSEWWDNEKQRFKRYCGFYFFVHTDEIRNSFDTLKKIEKYSRKGFKRPSWMNQPGQDVV